MAAGHETPADASNPTENGYSTDSGGIDQRTIVTDQRRGPMKASANRLSRTVRNRGPEGRGAIGRGESRKFHPPGRRHATQIAAYFPQKEFSAPPPKSRRNRGPGAAPQPAAILAQPGEHRTCHRPETVSEAK